MKWKQELQWTYLTKLIGANCRFCDFQCFKNKLFFSINRNWTEQTENQSSVIQFHLCVSTLYGPYNTYLYIWHGLHPFSLMFPDPNNSVFWFFLYTRPLLLCHCHCCYCFCRCLCTLSVLFIPLVKIHHWLKSSVNVWGWPLKTCWQPQPRKSAHNSQMCISSLCIPYRSSVMLCVCVHVWSCVRSWNGVPYFRIECDVLQKYFEFKINIHK